MPTRPITSSGISFAEISVPILTYHHVSEVPSVVTSPSTYVSPEAFTRQVGFLRLLGYRSIRVADVGRALRGEVRLSRRCVVFTFDDGWLDVYTEAFPILERAGFTGTVFVVGNALGQRGIAFSESRQQTPQRLMSAEQVRELAEKGWEIGAHTNSHRRLTRLTEEEVGREIVTGRRAVEVMTGIRPEVFAYPYGDFHAGVARVAESQGFLAACSTIPGRVHRPSLRFCLSRIPVAHDMSFFRFVYSLYFRPFQRGEKSRRKRLSTDWTSESRPAPSPTLQATPSPERRGTPYSGSR